MEVTVIAAKPPEKKQLRVAAYCRVSTDNEDQESSIENQKAHFEELINGNPDYENAGIYYDQGISGYKEDRPGFQKMMEDARAGKIDLIITKSITRFARNTDTILKATRELKELGIGVFFELQNMNTLTQGGELLMTIYAAFAQGESQNYRDLSILEVRRRFEAGKPKYELYKALGYREGKRKGTFDVVPEEAEVIKQIYKWVRDEYAIATILKMLKNAGYHTRTGKDFPQSLIYGIVRNVIYKGDYIMQSTYRDDNRKMHFNKGEVQSWYIENDHPPIVTKRLWAQANEVLDLRAVERLRPALILPMTEENYPYKNKNGRTCHADNVKDLTIQRAFIIAWNSVVNDRDKLLLSWETLKEEGDPLLALRAGQMIELTAQGPLSCDVPELTRMVLERIIIHSKTHFTVRFLDGTTKEVCLNNI